MQPQSDKGHLQMVPVWGLYTKEHQLPEERGQQYTQGRDTEDDQIDLGRRRSIFCHICTSFFTSREMMPILLARLASTKEKSLTWARPTPTIHVAVWQCPKNSPSTATAITNCRGKGDSF